MSSTAPEEAAELSEYIAFAAWLFDWAPTDVSARTVGTTLGRWHKAQCSSDQSIREIVFDWLYVLLEWLPELAQRPGLISRSLLAIVPLVTNEPTAAANAYFRTFKEKNERAAERTWPSVTYGKIGSIVLSPAGMAAAAAMRTGRPPQGFRLAALPSKELIIADLQALSLGTAPEDWTAPVSDFLGNAGGAKNAEALPSLDAFSVVYRAFCRGLPQSFTGVARHTHVAVYLYELYVQWYAKSMPQQTKPPDVPPAAPSRRKGYVQPGRTGKVGMTVYVDPPLAEAFRAAAILSGVPAQALLVDLMEREVEALSDPARRAQAIEDAVARYRERLSKALKP